MAGFSDGTQYVNQLLTTNGVFNEEFRNLLTQVWDFDDQSNPVSDNNLSPAIVQNVPVRTYNDSTADATPKPSAPPHILIDLPPSSWNNYPSALQGVAQEVPPLPGQDPTITNDTHHRIRDFMFLDAALNRIFSNSSSSVGPAPDITTSQGVICHVNRLDLDPVFATENATGDQPQGPQVSKGTGRPTTSGKLLVDETTVTSGGLLEFLQKDVSINLFLYELQDQEGNAVPEAPNWFGVAVPDGVTDFSKPILYFHPTPGPPNNTYADTPDYGTKTATGPKSGNGRDWRELFAYVDRLGNQLDGAIQQSPNPNQTVNQIVILPFMTSGSANAAGITFLKSNWLAIITDILQNISANPSRSGNG